MQDPMNWGLDPLWSTRDSWVRVNLDFLEETHSYSWARVVRYFTASNTIAPTHQSDPWVPNAAFSVSLYVLGSSSLHLLISPSAVTAWLTIVCWRTSEKSMLPLMLAESSNSSSSRRQLGTEWNVSPYSWYVYAVIPPTLSLGSHDLRNFHANCSSWPFSCQYSKVSWSFTFLSSVISFFWSWIHLFSRAAYVGKLCLIYHFRD